jgi:hypothetical protein
MERKLTRSQSHPSIASPGFLCPSPPLIAPDDTLEGLQESRQSSLSRMPSREQLVTQLCYRRGIGEASTSSHQRNFATAEASARHQRRGFISHHLMFISRHLISHVRGKRACGVRVRAPTSPHGPSLAPPSSRCQQTPRVIPHPGKRLRRSCLPGRRMSRC